MATSTMAGLRVGVTASRKSVQLTSALEQRGAEVVLGPMLAGDQPVGDATLVAATRVILAQQPNWIVASTGVGMRLWLEAADRGGVGQELRTLLQEAKCVARGAKAVGGLAGAGPEAKPVWVSDLETDSDVAAWLGTQLSDGDRLAVQLHGGMTCAFDHLQDTGIEVATVTPYTSPPPVDDEPARALIRELVGGHLDLVTFTSPNAAHNLDAIARSMGPEIARGVQAQLTGPTAVASIGPVTTEAIEQHGAVVTIVPDRHRTGDLLRAIERWAGTRTAG